jgi:peptide/nickel transport system permease protein
MRAAYGLDLPWHVAYVRWVGRLVQFDLGTSMSKNVPVAALIGERIGPTLMLSVSSLLLAYLLSIPMGLYATVRANRFDERVLGVVLYMLYSFPAFVAALFLQILFAQRLNWLPLLGMTSPNYAQLSPAEQAWDVLMHSILPIACYTYGSLAYYSRFIRANMQEVIRQDYIRTAQAKGASPASVVLHHAFRNTLIPLVTLIGLTLPTLLSGAIILEQIFAWPGMGTLFFESIRQRDYPTIMGLVLMFSILTLLGQLLSDVLYAAVDPRVTYD